MKEHEHLTKLKALGASHDEAVSIQEEAAQKGLNLGSILALLSDPNTLALVTRLIGLFGK